MCSLHPPVEVDQPLSRDQAVRIAWTLYGTDSPAVVELLVLAHNPDASTLKRYAAEMALTWFDPSADLPARPSDDEDPEAVRLLRLAFLSGEVATRVAAGDQLAELLRRAAGADRKDAWSLAGGSR